MANKPPTERNTDFDERSPVGRAVQRTPPRFWARGYYRGKVHFAAVHYAQGQNAYLSRGQLQTHPKCHVLADTSIPAGIATTNLENFRQIAGLGDLSGRTIARVPKEKMGYTY